MHVTPRCSYNHQINKMEVDVQDRKHNRVVVIGAGIVGASLAYNLSRKGAAVTLVDAGDIACGVTGTSFAWINVSHTGFDPIAQLRSLAVNEFRRLEVEVPDLKIRWTGALTYGERFDETLQNSGNKTAENVVSRTQVLDIEPNLRHPPEYALYDAQVGALDAVKTTHALIAAAKAQGAHVLTHTRVLGFTTLNARVTGLNTAIGKIDADRVVIAAGTGTKKLTDMLNVSLPIEESPAIFIRYKAPANLVRTIISSPAMEVRQDGDGSLLAAEDYLGDAPENQPEAVALRTAKAIQEALHGADSIEPQLACVGLRPFPADGIPIVGYLPNVSGVYVCTMHPGVILAPIVGRLASEEILDAKVAPALSPCRPDRFFKP